MIIVFVLVVLGIGVEVKFKPRFNYVRSCDRLVMWYNTGGRYSKERNFIEIYEK